MLLTVNPLKANQVSIKSGPLFGLHAGYSHMATRFNNSFNDGLGLADSFTRANGSSALSTWLIGATVGYQHIFKSTLTLGADVTLDYFYNNNLQKVLFHDIDPFKSYLERNLTFIPEITFGKTFAHNKVHAFIGLGMAVTRFSLRVDNVNDRRGTKDDTKVKLGFVPSVGLEIACTPSISLMGKVSYEMYEKINRRFSGPEIAPDLGNSIYSYEAKPRFIAAKLGIVYRP
jgi:hypothetical protein